MTRARLFPPPPPLTTLAKVINPQTLHLNFIIIVNMPPRKKTNTSTPVVRTAADRVLQKTSVPLRQAKFPSPNKRIRTYSTKASKPILKSQRQDTLTQIWPQGAGGAPQDEEDQKDNVQEEDDELALPQEPPKSRRRKTMGDDVDDSGEYVEGSEKRNKRRKKILKMQDEEENVNIDQEETKKSRKRRRKTLGDTPVSDSQTTLTQMPLFSNYAEALDNDPIKDKSIYDVPSSSQSGLPNARRQPVAPKSHKVTKPARNSRHTNTILPQTPHGRRFPAEIPSSNSPLTPMSSESMTNFAALIRESPLKRHTPLKEKSVNESIPFSITPKTKTMLPPYPRLECKDTFATIDESQQSHIKSTSEKRSTPGKSVRFAPMVTFSSPVQPRESLDNRLRQSTPRPTIFKDEISDSEDDEDDGNYNLDNEATKAPTENNPDLNIPLLKVEEPPPIEHTQILDKHGSEHPPDIGRDPEMEEQIVNEAEPETCYGVAFGPETQLELDRVVSSAEAETNVEESQFLGEPTQNKSRYMSQRISTQHANAMEPRTSESDAFICVHPSQIKHILSRTKTHEIRKFALLPNTVRIWLYETAPKSRVKYMAEIGSAILAGEILDGEGTDTNPKIVANGEFAYEIIGLYELADPISFANIKERGWFKAPPPRFTCVRPAPLDELMANLQPPLFKKDDFSQETRESLATDTQEVVEQLANNIKQFTQPIKIPSADASSEPEIKVEDSGPRENDDLELEFDPDCKSQEELELPPLLQQTPQLPRASQTETVDLTQAEPSDHHSPSPIIFESPTRSVISSTPSLPTLPTPRVQRYQRSDSVVPFSMASSQLLTKSQMLPDSLLNNSIPGPPIVSDSDDEDY